MMLKCIKAPQQELNQGNHGYHYIMYRVASSWCNNQTGSKVKTVIVITSLHRKRLHPWCHITSQWPRFAYCMAKQLESDLTLTKSGQARVDGDITDMRWEQLTNHNRVGQLTNRGGLDFTRSIGARKPFNNSQWNHESEYKHIGLL